MNQELRDGQMELRDMQREIRDLQREERNDDVDNASPSQALFSRAAHSGPRGRLRQWNAEAQATLLPVAVAAIASRNI